MADGNPQQIELLVKMLNFYKKRYSGTTLEDKFNAACIDLIDTGDITRGTFVKFCVDNDIEPKAPKKKSSSSSSSSSASSSYTSSGCGGGGYTRSSC